MIGKTQLNESLNMSSEEKEALGSVKARFLNRNGNELEYLLNQIANENEHENLNIDRGLMNNLDSDKSFKIIQQEILLQMDESVAANSVHSQIIFTDFILLFFSIVSISICIIELEMNYNYLDNINDLAKYPFQNKVHLVTLSICSLLTVFMLINIIFRYKLQIEFEILTRNLGKKDSLFSSGYFKYMLIEILVIVIHPNIFVDKFTFKYKHTNKDKPADIIHFTVNDYLFFFMLFRCIYLIKYILSLSKYKSSRGSRICKLYGEINNSLFSIRSIFNKNPFKFIIFCFFFGLFFFSVSIRNFERPFTTKGRNESLKTDSTDENNFNSYYNSLWFTFTTILPTGYGDFKPITAFGRITSVVCILYGLILMSLNTVVFFNMLNLTSQENKVYILLKRTYLRKNYSNIQGQLVKEMLKKHFAKFKIRKIREYQDEFIDTLTSLEKKAKDKEMKSWENLKNDCDVKISSLIRSKNNIIKYIYYNYLIM